MAFHNLHDFLHMGGYAIYVWSSYGILLASVIGFSVYWLRCLQQEKKSNA